MGWSLGFRQRCGRHMRGIASLCFDGWLTGDRVEVLQLRTTFWQTSDPDCWCAKTWIRPWLESFPLTLTIDIPTPSASPHPFSGLRLTSAHYLFTLETFGTHSHTTVTTSHLQALKRSQSDLTLYQLNPQSPHTFEELWANFLFSTQVWILSES